MPDNSKVESNSAKLGMGVLGVGYVTQSFGNCCDFVSTSATGKA